MKIDIRKTATDAGHIALGAGVVAAQQVQATAQLALARVNDVQEDLGETIDKARAELESRAAEATALANSLRERIAEQTKALTEAAEPYTEALRTKASELITEAKERIEPAVERITDLVNRRAA